MADKKKNMLLTGIFLLLATNLWSQTDLGIGLVSINFDDKTILHLYTNPDARQPVKTIDFFDDKSINGWNIRALEQQKKWLKPEVLWVDYSSFIFRCLAVKGNWFKVIVNNEDGSALWLKKSEQTTFRNWETYLIEMFGVERLDDQPQKIRTSPKDNSEEIKYQGRDCFQVKSMRGAWIEIFTADSCDEPDTNPKIKSGWIKWRQGNKLLIDYFITS